MNVRTSATKIWLHQKSRKKSKVKVDAKWKNKETLLIYHKNFFETKMNARKSNYRIHSTQLIVDNFKINVYPYM